MEDEQWRPSGYAKIYKVLIGVSAACLVSAAATLAIPGSQIYGWLRLGAWQPISNQDGLAYLGIKSPQSDCFLTFCLALKFSSASRPPGPAA